MKSRYMKYLAVTEESEQQTMRSTLTNQQDCERHAGDDNLHSLNLKIENNFREHIVLIVGIDDNHYLFEQLSSIVNKDAVLFVNDFETSLALVQYLYNTDIFLIISGNLGQTCAREFAIMPQIIGLYIYCIDEDKHAMSATEIKRVRCVVSNTAQLLTRLHADIKKLSSRWPVGQNSFRKASTSTSEWYHLFLLIIVHRSQHIKESYHEMLNECRAYYNNSDYIIRETERFEQTYNSADAIYEYTRGSFVYRIVNHALRVQDMEIIRKFSPYIRDLHSQLYNHHEEYCRSSEQTIRAVYRGQYLSSDELEYLRIVCKSRNPVITLTAFGSTSLDPEVALTFILPGADSHPCLFEIIITDEYNKEQTHKDQHEQVFANISSLSSMKYEQEVLFSLVTHFRVKYVGCLINHLDHPYVPIVFELTRDKQEKCDFSHFNIVSCIRKETDQLTYANILHMIQMNAADELNFNDTDWQKWWNKLAKKWGMYKACKQPLLLIFYECFTDNKYWLRKAVEMHKDNLRSYFEAESNPPSFSDLFPKLNPWQKVATRWIALYEEYLKPFCTTDTKETIACLQFAGQTYEMIADKESALKCYQKALDFDVHDNSKTNHGIQSRINILQKPSKTTRTMNTRHTAVATDTDKELSPIYEVQGEQWSVHWSLKRIAPANPAVRTVLRKLSEYLIKREEWYDAADSKIILRLPFGITPNLSIDDYRSNFLVAAKMHIMSNETDATNNRFLSSWRYERYMHEWMLFNELKRFLQPFQEKSTCIHSEILPRLDQLTEKLSVLITLCTVYICIEQQSGTINVNDIEFINMKNFKTNQLIFFDLQDNALLADLQALQTEIPTSVDSCDYGPDPFEYLRL